MSKTLDLLVINSGAAHGITGNHPIYGSLGDTLIAIEPPVWCRIIAAYAREREFKVQILDAEAEGLSPRAVAALTKDKNPRLVVLAVYGHQPSASSQQMYGAGLTAKEIKYISPDQKIMMVGGHVAALPERTMEEEFIDYACNGEGPETIVQLLIRMNHDTSWNESQVMGLVWRDAATLDIRQNPPAPLLDIDNLSGNAWDLLPMTRYRAHNWQCFGDIGRRQPYASIFTSLGCPYKCQFCCINAPFHSNRYRMRSPARVVQEIEMLQRDYGVNTFKIVDEMFVLNRTHYAAICQSIVDRGLNRNDELNLWAYARVDTVHPENLALLRNAGVRWLALGIESASTEVLDGANKRLKPREVADVVDAIQRAGISVIGNFIFGLRFDTHETMRATLDLAKSLRLDFANFYSAQAYPGSPLYDEALRNGWTLPETWRGYSQHNDDCRPLDTEHILGSDVLRFRDAAFDEYFTDPAYLARITQKFGQDTAAHVRDMTKYKLKRKLLEAA